MGVVCLVFGFGDRVACNPGRSQTIYVAKADLEHHVFCEESFFKIFSLNYFNVVGKEARVEGEGKDSKAACTGAAVILMNSFCFSKFNVQEQNRAGRQIKPRDYRGR